VPWRIPRLCDEYHGAPQCVPRLFADVWSHSHSPTAYPDSSPFIGTHPTYPSPSSLLPSSFFSLSPLLSLRSPTLRRSPPRGEGKKKRNRLVNIRARRRRRRGGGEAHEGPLRENVAGGGNMECPHLAQSVRLGDDDVEGRTGCATKDLPFVCAGRDSIRSAARESFAHFKLALGLNRAETSPRER